MNAFMLRPVFSALGCLGIAAAAFGAHGLERIANPEQIRWWVLATALLLVTVPVGLGVGVFPSKFRAISGWLLLVGLLLFSGSLYAMALGAPRWFGAVTPLGGLSLIVAWASLALAPPQE